MQSKITFSQGQCPHLTPFWCQADKLAALWPFLGICAEVAILCIIIFVYEKRRAKKMQAEEAPEEAGQL